MDIINQQLTCGPRALHLPIQLPYTKWCYAASKFAVESSIWYILYQQIPNQNSL